MTIFATTPSQTVGPYFAIGLPFDAGPYVVPAGTPHQMIVAPGKSIRYGVVKTKP